MAQQVQAVDNPNFSVAPLTTVSSTIVSRRRVKVPVNFQGTYGPQKSSSNYIATFDIADNECFVDLSKLCLCVDFTPKWYNEDLTATTTRDGVEIPSKFDRSNNFYGKDTMLCPTLDQTTQAFFFRITIGTSQGLKIEEIHNYSTWSNIVDMHTLNATYKEMSTLNRGNWSKEWGKDQGNISFLDGDLSYPACGYFKHGEKTRLEIRFEHSSFLNRVRFLPLFLFRNGLRFEIEMEDVHRTFCYQISPPLRSMLRFDQVCSATTPAAGKFSFPNWFTSQGTVDIAGQSVALTKGFAGDSALAGQTLSDIGFVPYAHLLPPPFGGKEVTVTNTTTATLYGPQNGGCLHMLNVTQDIYKSIFNRTLTNRTHTNSEAFIGDYDFICIPTYITEGGDLVYKGIVALAKGDIHLEYNNFQDILRAGPTKSNIPPTAAVTEKSKNVNAADLATWDYIGTTAAQASTAVFVAATWRLTTFGADSGFDTKVSPGDIVRFYIGANNRPYTGIVASSTGTSIVFVDPVGGANAAGVLEPGGGYLPVADVGASADPALGIKQYIWKLRNPGKTEASPPYVYSPTILSVNEDGRFEMNPNQIPTASIDETRSASKKTYHALPFYFYNKGGMNHPFYYKKAFTHTDRVTAFSSVEVSKRQAGIFFDIDNQFIVPHLSYKRVAKNAVMSPRDISFLNKVIDPYMYEQVWTGSGGTNNKLIQWGYQMENMEMLLDLVKPSSDTFLRFQQVYQSPSGIPYQFKRVIYKSNVQKITGNGTGGLYQIPLAISVRSLTGIVIAMQDSYFTNPGTAEATDFGKYSTPLLSSFMRRGLNRAEVVIGGQTVPVYPLLTKPMNTNSSSKPGQWSFSHLLEAENFFGVPGQISFNPTFSNINLQNHRNYLLAGSMTGLTSAVVDSVATTTGITPTYLDTSSFVLAMSLKKDDVMDFATGIDSSQSGSITLNLYFNTSDDTDPGSKFSRDITYHIWSICDAVFTCQNDANLVRY